MRDGGRAAARGLHFQYLVTVDHLLDMLAHDSQVVAVHVEHPEHRAAGDAQIIDLETEGPDASIERVVQVKSVEDPATGDRLTAPEAWRQLRRLTGAGEARRFDLVVNAQLTEPARDLAARLDAGLTRDGLRGLARDLGLDTESITDAEEVRLTRGRIVAVPGTVWALRARVAERVRGARRAGGTGVGATSSGLVTAYLVDQVFQRASGAGGTRIDREQMAAMLAVSPRTVADALGRYDWGIPIGRWPSGEGVQRSALHDAMDGLLPDLAVAERPTAPHIAVLRGMSGIGKSTLAAQYANEHADRYDFLWWFDGSSSDGVTAGLLALAAAAFPDLLRGGPPEPAAVAQRLAEHPGPWLAVADDVNRDTDLGWLPLHAHGHVIATTTDAALWPAMPGLAVGAMDPAESRELLESVLGPQSAGPASLDRVAETLEHWPLALAMAASYLRGAQTPVDHAAGEYLDDLAHQSVRDRTALPREYPRTVEQAVLLAADAVGAADAVPAGVVRCAVATIDAAAYVSGADVPVRLLLTAAVSTMDAEVIPDLPSTIVDDVVRLLRSRSLVERTWRPSADGSHSDRLTFNTVTQHVLRERLEQRTPQRPVAVLAGLAAATATMLAHDLDAERYPETLALVPHAESITHHAERLGVPHIDVALLNGNLALAFKVLGHFDRAVAVLRRELRHLDALAVAVPGLRADVVRAKTGIQLAEAVLRSDAATVEALDALDDALSAIARASQGTPQRPEALSRLVQSVIHLARACEASAGGGVTARQLRRRAEELARLMPADPQGDMLDAQHHLDDLLRSGGHDVEVAEEAAAWLGRELGLLARITFCGLRGEALTRASRDDEALDALDDLIALVDEHDVYVDDALEQVTNVVIAALGRATPTFPIAAKGLDWAAGQLDRGTPATVQRVHVLQAWAATHRGDAVRARSELGAIVGELRPDEDFIHSLVVGWLDRWA